MSFTIMDTTSNILFSKLDEFIGKYYKNQIIKGIIISILILLLYFVSLSVLEYFSYFSIPIRRFLFYFSIVLIISTISFYIIYPLLHLFKIGKVLDYSKAATIIAKYFPEVQDKLHNTLQLIDLSQLSSNSLIIASINQRISLLKPLPFTLAINVKANYKYFKIVGILIILLLPIFLFYPTIFTDGAIRIIKHETYFEPKMPFSFTLTNKVLQIEKGSDYTFTVTITGDYIPSNDEISIGTTSYFMQKVSPSQFTFTLKGINNSINFCFIADEYKSKMYTLSVLPSPQILSFTLTADIPEYTGEKNFTLKNVGDISVPEGTQLRWNIDAIESNKMFLKYNDSSLLNLLMVDNQFEATLKALKSTKYTILSSNDYIKQKQLLTYSITVIPDLFPTIDLDVKTDSSNMFLNYFTGTIKDDYGFNKMNFVCYK